MRVLIADDDNISRRMLEGLVRSWQYEVEAVADGDAAWEILNDGNSPRVALLDWRMPGLNGMEICRRVQESDEIHVYTMLITQDDDGDALSNALDLGADDFVAKPVNANELRSRLGVAKRTVGYWLELQKRHEQVQLFATEMKELAEARAKQLVHAERMATIGMLSAGVAHEINNPTTFISGNAQSLKRFWKDAARWLEQTTLDEDDAQKRAFVLEEVPQALDGILNGVGRISSIVKGLKSYSRRDRGSEQEKCSVNDCVGAALQLCAHQLKNTTIEVDVDKADDLPPFLGDSQQIEQIIVNLIVNASHAAEEAKPGKIFIATQFDGEDVVVSVQDNGTGIPEKLLEKIWDPFFTTKHSDKGTGLGLAICRDIARDHNGTLDARNVSGSGARFELKIPAVRDDETNSGGVLDEASAASG